MKTKLFLPGPVEVEQEILEEMATPPIGHRTGDFRELFREIREKLKPVFGTSGEIFIFPSSATGAMEAAIRNCVGTKVLCLVNGAFGKRWAEIAKLCGKEVETVEAEWGKALRPETVGAAMRDKVFDAICLVHVESSTGVMNPLPEIAEVVHRSGSLFLVDAVASLGAIRLDTDKLKIDVCLTGSQKGLALPPGIALMSVSDRAMEKSRSVENKGFYFNFELLKDRARSDEPLTTPSTSHMFALKRQLDRLEDEGLENRENRHHELAALCRSWAESCGFKVFSEKGFEAPTLTCMENNLNIDTAKLLNFLESRGFIIDDGYGPLKKKTIRIGHMGDHQLEDLRQLTSAFDEFLRDQRNLK